MVTSTYREVSPVHALNKFLWARLSAENILTAADYSGVIPIVPIEETPDLLTIIESQPGMGSKPFIVYNWTKIDTGQMWMVETHEIAYSVRSADQKKMRQIINVFDDSFKKYDDSAQAVNAYLATSGASANLRQFYFQSINISALGGQMPTDTEDGMGEALISLRVLFTGP